ncbi:aldehyde dehydrogenase [Ktedonobacteria bacterium brp13]|nr:aldehyde dehydrogenase [Ktedonobacteria bacterium brp13]
MVLNYQLFIDGDFRPATQGGVIEVMNPATEDVYATVASALDEDVQEAVTAAKRAQPAWAKLPAIERGRALNALARELRQHTEELARILTYEQGKVLSLARGEVAAAADYLDFTAEWARRYEGEILQSDRPNENIFMFTMPVGVVAGILPWNYPLFLLVRKLAPALLTGNTIVIKPSEETPVNACEFGRLVQQAGLPAGVVNILPGGRETGDLLCRHLDIRLISFTGSVAAGKQIMAAAATHMARVSLELGGKAPCIVMEDADIELAVNSIRDSRIHNAGQVCNCAERVYVQRGRLAEFSTRLVEAMRQVRFGDPFDETMDYGPLINDTRRQAITHVVREAINDGAELLTGGGYGPHKRGFYFEPTVLGNCTQNMRLVREETFGPVLPIIAFDELDEALAMVNDSEYGLTSSIYTRSLHTAMRASNELQYGETYVNRAHSEAIQAFHSGWKQSGIGGADGKYGLLEYTQKRVVYMQN